jgi:hypothetical protein
MLLTNFVILFFSINCAGRLLRSYDFTHPIFELQPTDGFLDKSPVTLREPQTPDKVDQSPLPLRL